MKLGWHCFWKRMRHLQRMYRSTLTIWRCSLMPASGLHIRKGKKKTGCRGPCTQSAHGAAWRTTMETRSATGSGGPATAAGSSFLTAWWRHQLHTQQNNNYWRKTERENDASSVNCCVDEMFISEFGDHIACLVIYRDLMFQSQETEANWSFLNMILFIRKHKKRGGNKIK